MRLPVCRKNPLHLQDPWDIVCEVEVVKTGECLRVRGSLLSPLQVKQLQSIKLLAYSHHAVLLVESPLNFLFPESGLDEVNLRVVLAHLLERQVILTLFHQK